MKRVQQFIITLFLVIFTFAVYAVEKNGTIMGNIKVNSDYDGINYIDLQGGGKFLAKNKPYKRSLDISFPAPNVGTIEYTLSFKKDRSNKSECTVKFYLIYDNYEISKYKVTESSNHNCGYQIVPDLAKGPAAVIIEPEN